MTEMSPGTATKDVGTADVIVGKFPIVRDWARDAGPARVSLTAIAGVVTALLLIWSFVPG